MAWPNVWSCRSGWNFEVGGGGNEVSGSSGEAVEGVDTSHVTREQRLLYGLKALVTEQQSWMPQSVVILQGYTPTGGETPATQLLATYAFGWRLPNRWRFDSSLRFATDSDNGNRFEVWRRFHGAAHAVGRALPGPCRVLRPVFPGPAEQFHPSFLQPRNPLPSTRESRGRRAGRLGTQRAIVPILLQHRIWRAFLNANAMLRPSSVMGPPERSPAMIRKRPTPERD